MKPKMEQPTTNQNWVSASKTCRVRLYPSLGKMDVAICEWNLLIIISGISRGRLTSCTCARGHLLHVHVESTPSQHESTNIKLTPSLTKQGFKNLEWLLSIHSDIVEGAWCITAGAFSTQAQWNKRIPCPKSQATESCPGCHQQTIFFRKRLQNYVQHADFVCALLHHALSQFGPKEILGNSAKVSRPGRLIWAAISDEWLPLLGRTSQTVQDCPHTDGHPSSHNHGKWIMTTSY